MLDNLEFTNLQYIHNILPTVSIFINLHCLVIKWYINCVILYSQTYLVRAGQPISSSKRCKEDELLLNAFVIAGKKAYIVDTRTFPPGKQNKGKQFSDFFLLLQSKVLQIP